MFISFSLYCCEAKNLNYFCIKVTTVEEVSVKCRPKVHGISGHEKRNVFLTLGLPRAHFDPYEKTFR